MGLCPKTLKLGAYKHLSVQVEGVRCAILSLQNVEILAA